jgi:hypothetical protein
VGLGFSHPLVFVLPVAWAALWRALPSRARLPLIGVGVLWAAALTGYYWLFFRHQAIPDLVAYWVQDFPDFSGLGAFLSWLVQAWRRYVLYFFGERSLWWGLPVLAAGVAALIQRGPARLLWYWAGPLGLALVAAALHRYPFMGHSGGSRLMLFSAPALYIVAAVGLSAAAQGLWRRRQVWALALLLGVFLWAVQPLRLVKENLHPTPNRADIEPLVAYLTEQRRPADWVYVYYFATAPFQYYYRGDGEKVIWGKSCAERGLCLPPSQYQGVRRLWLISAHYPDLNYMKQFAAHLLGPGWVQTLLLEQEGAALFFFERQPAAGP